MSKLERIIKFAPAFDKRDPDPKKNYGTHGVELKMVVKGSKGAVQFVLFTNWQLPHVTKESENRLCAKIEEMFRKRSAAENTVITADMPDGIKSLINEVNSVAIHIEQSLEEEISLQLHCFWQPCPADLGYHSRVPMYEGHTAIGSVKYNTKQSVELYEGLIKENLLESMSEEEKLNILIPERTETGTFTPCDYLDGAPCYYDGSGLNADRIYKILLTEGSDGVWRELEEYYEEIFKDIAEPVLAERVRSSEGS